MSTPRYVTVDPLGRIVEVSGLHDRFGQPTLDPELATRCVIQLQDGTWWAAPTDEVPIYTVH